MVSKKQEKHHSFQRDNNFKTFRVDWSIPIHFFMSWSIEIYNKENSLLLNLFMQK